MEEVEKETKEEKSKEEENEETLRIAPRSRQQQHGEYCRRPLPCYAVVVPYAVSGI